MGYRHNFKKISKSGTFLLLLNCMEINFTVRGSWPFGTKLEISI